MGIGYWSRILGPWVIWIALSYWSLVNLSLEWFMMIYIGGGLAATIVTATTE